MGSFHYFSLTWQKKKVSFFLLRSIERWLSKRLKTTAISTTNTLALKEEKITFHNKKGGNKQWQELATTNCIINMGKRTFACGLVWSQFFPIYPKHVFASKEVVKINKTVFILLVSRSKNYKSQTTHFAHLIF